MSTTATATAATAACGSAGDELAHLRAELAAEEAELAQLEQGVGVCSAQLSYLNAEYTANLARIERYYGPRRQPLYAATHAVVERRRLIEMQIGWLEKKIAQQDRCATENGLFMECRDMRPAAEEMQRAAEQELLRAYADIEACPAEVLRVLIGFENPPDTVVLTMHMVMRLRGEADGKGPILDENGATVSTGGGGEVADNVTAASAADGSLSLAASRTILKGGTVSTGPTPAAAARGAVTAEQQLLHAAVASWPHARVLASHNYFTNFFQPRSEGMLRSREVLSPEVAAALEDFFANPAHTVDRLAKCSTPIGCLGRWLHAVREVYRVRMVTAPVLLRDGDNTTVEGVARIQEMLDRATYGDMAVDAAKAGPGLTPPPLSRRGSSSSGSTGAVVALVSAKAEEERPRGTIIEVDAELMEKYQRTKKRLSELSRPSVASRDALYRLRHRLCQLDEESAGARERLADLDADMAGRVAELQGTYDDTMLPVEDQLEEGTTAFVTLLTGEAPPE